MSDEISRARRILADPHGLMLPNYLGRALVARIDKLEAALAEIIAEKRRELGIPARSTPKPPAAPGKDFP